VAHPTRTSRRHFLQQTGTVTLASSLGPAALAAAPAPPLDPAASYALETASRLGRGRALNLILPSGSEANLQPLIRLFTAQTGVEVLARYVPVNDVNTYLLLAASKKDADFDIGLPASFGLTDLVEAKAIAPLDEYVARHEPKGYRNGLMQQADGSWQGRYYGYQTDGDVYLGFLNRQVLRAADRHKRFADQTGRPADQFSSWAELDELMAFYSAPDEQRYGGNLFRIPDYAVWEFWLRLHETGTLPFDADMRPQITSDAATAALQALVDATGSLAPGVRGASLFDNWRDFKRGSSLINIGWGGSQKAFQQSTSLIRNQIAAFEPPASDSVREHGLPYFNWGWNYTVARASAQPELAYLFMLFACSPSASTLAVREVDGYFDPFRAEHYSDPAIQSTYSPEFLELHQASLTHCLPDCHIGGQADYFSALARFISLAVDGKLTAGEALNATASRWRALTRRRGQDLQASAWAQVRARYPETYLGGA
jgi:multiple sugar transport system substrate-binding protein